MILVQSAQRNEAEPDINEEYKFSKPYIILNHARHILPVLKLATQASDAQCVTADALLRESAQSKNEIRDRNNQSSNAGPEAGR